MDWPSGVCPIPTFHYLIGLVHPNKSLDGVGVALQVFPRVGDSRGFPVYQKIPKKVCGWDQRSC